MHRSEFTDYLGDGVYAAHDGYQIWLGTERDGRWETIALEPGVYDRLIDYAKRIEQQRHEAAMHRLTDDGLVPI